MSVEFSFNDQQVPEVTISGESIGVVSYTHHFVTDGLGGGVNLITATVLTGCDNDLCGVTQSVICHNNLTGETYFQ